MLRRIGLIATAASVAALAIVAAAVARPATVAATSAVSCKKAVSVGILAPITGPVASIGSDQLHWAQFYFTQWNKNKKHVQIKLVQGDTQLDPSKASTVSQSFASNGSILGVIGPAGSDEVQPASSILKKAGLAFASGSATRVSLTDGSNRGFFFRDVPNDSVQGPTTATYMTTKLGVKTGDTVMIVDDQESYSTGLADIVGAALTNNAIKNIKVDRESISQKATDFSSLVAKVNNNVKVVYLPFQLASQAQLFAQQLKAQGKTAIVFGSDGTFDSSKFTVDGSYISFFAPDVTTIPADAAVVSAFKKQYPGATSPFGAPNYVLAQMYANAITTSCKDGKITRAELRKNFAKVSLTSTILGTPIRFTANGDLAGAKFHIFKIVNGKYETVQ
ncbi:MAG: branched-chain amino acid transport system substrate-binding protein [Gaiellaceae bacterium]|nr:branched-chain amino acid transport system substrate-binding protein [Gaiellaceae bacterium]